MQPTTLSLIESLDRERQKRQLSHRQFSFLLGIDPAYWHRIRNGERPMTLSLLTLFMQKLPKVTPEVTYYIMRQGNDADNKKGGDEIINPDNSRKPPKKMGVEKTSDYLEHGNPKNTPKKPSKNAREAKIKHV